MKNHSLTLKQNKVYECIKEYMTTEMAEVEFKRILDREEYIPALVNMGNLNYFRSNFDQALFYYNLAFQKSPNNSKALLGIARINFDKGLFTTASDTYEQLAELDQQIANKASFLRSDAKSTDLGTSQERELFMAVWAY